VRDAAIAQVPGPLERQHTVSLSLIANRAAVDFPRHAMA